MTRDRVGGGVSSAMIGSRPFARWLAVLLLASVLRVSAAEAAGATAKAAEPRHVEDFHRGLGRWSVEQQPGGTVIAESGRMIINDAGGCTVWFRPKLVAPVEIAYTAVVAAAPRISDLNCFWMATDPARRATCSRPDTSATVPSPPMTCCGPTYVGYGGNDNTTTRFRRYPGDGTRPLLPPTTGRKRPCS